MSFSPKPDQFANERQPLAALADLEEINQSLKIACIGLQFEFDDATGQIVARVVNVETGKQIRQMPSEELMQLSRVLGKLHVLLVHQAICRKAQLTEQSRVPAPTRWSNSLGSLGVPGR